VCHALLEDPKFHSLLLRIDHELAEQTRADGCRCGGVLHRADYPRKPRGCPRQARPQHSSRLSFCCAQCRKRSTSKSVRFLGRRVYLALAVVLVPARRAGPAPAAAAQLAQTLGATRRTLQRWQLWWSEQFPLTPLWRAGGARFMPPVPTETDPPQRDRWARLRFSIIGPLLAAPPAPGEVHGPLATLAARTWRHPISGQDVRFGLSTIERWYYAARSAADPIAALRDRPRPRRPLREPERRASSTTWCSSTANIRAGPRNCTWTICARARGQPG
jgi:hypothetical protein